MKIKFDKETFRVSFYVFLVIAASILFFKVVDNFSNAFDSFRIIIGFVLNLFKPFILGGIIAYFLYRPVRWLEERLFQDKIKRQKLRRAISIIVIYIIIFVLLWAFLSFSIPRIAKNINDLIIGIPNYIEDLGVFITELDINQRIENFIDNLPIDSNAIRSYNFFENIDAYINNLLDNAQNTLEQLVIYILNSAISITFSFFTLIVALFIAFYIIKDKEDLFSNINKYFTSFHPKRVNRWREVIKITDELFGKYLVGNIINSLIIGILCFIGVLLLNIRFALLISLIVGVTNLIPFFGPFIGGIPVVIITLFDSPIKALWMGLFILALQQFDGNILKPKVLGDKVGLSAFWVLFAIIIGGGLFGILGMFLGVPTIAVIRVLINQAIERKKSSNDQIGTY